MLGFQTQPGAVPVRPVSFASQCAVELVARIELDSRLVSDHLQHPAAFGLDRSCGQRRRTGRAVQHPRVVVTEAVLQLLVGRADVLAYPFGRRKSNGVPSTDAGGPVGMESESTGR